MTTCAVPACHSRKSVDRGVVLHEFPANLDRRETWILAVRSVRPLGKDDPWLPSEYTKICSKHFKADDYIQGPKKRYLAPHAVPSRFPRNLSKPPPPALRRSRKKHVMQIHQDDTLRENLNQKDRPTQKDGGHEDRTQNGPRQKNLHRKLVLQKDVSNEELNQKDQSPKNPAPKSLVGNNTGVTYGKVAPRSTEGSVKLVERGCQTDNLRAIPDKAELPQRVGDKSNVPETESSSCQTLVTGLAISAYHMEMFALKEKCSHLQAELNKLREGKDALSAAGRSSSLPCGK